MSRREVEQSISRRNFMRAAAVTAVAATATGAGAALLVDTSQAPLPMASLAPALKGAVVQDGRDITVDLFAQLAAAQAENIRLQANLDGLKRRLEVEEAASSDAVVLRAELDSASNQIGLLSGLLALYEQLDQLDVGKMLEEGVANVSDTISTLLDELPTLEEGLEAGRQALDDLEQHIPIVEAGQRWVDSQIGRLQAAFANIESLVERFADGAGSFLELLNEWIQSVLKWLPFGLGQRTGQILQAITALLIQVPDAISGLGDGLVQPLDAWLSQEDGEPALKRKLVRPLRESVLTPAGRTSQQARQVQAVYQAQITEPVKVALAYQQRVRGLIDDYRQQHQL